MFIEKEFHFYAAHRNETLQGSKCERFHGHTYHVNMSFLVERHPDNPHISMLFEDFDEIEDFINRNLDHRLLINENDPFFHFIPTNIAVSSAFADPVIFPFPTSVENLCFWLFGHVVEMGFPLNMISIKETTSSTVVYSQKDFAADQKLFESEPEQTGPCPGEWHSATSNICSLCGLDRWAHKLAHGA